MWIVKDYGAVCYESVAVTYELHFMNVREGRTFALVDEVLRA